MNYLSKLIKIVVPTVMTLICSTALYGEEQIQKINEPTVSYPFEKEKTYSAIIHTSKGKIECQLYPDEAPLSVTNFMQLAEKQFYNGLRFHNVVAGFIIQSGDPDGTGSGGPGYTLASEIGLKHEQGSLAWARVPDNKINPFKRSSGSQFYITLDRVSFLDGEYSVFGQVIDGFDVIKNISLGDKIEKIEILIK